MKKFVFIVLLAITVFAVNAKEKEAKTNATNTEAQATLTLSGTIADENSGESLVGVEVKIEGTDLKTYTNFDGYFSFEGVKPGEYKLSANYISYERKSEVLEINPQTNDIKIKLQSSN